MQTSDFLLIVGFIILYNTTAAIPLYGIFKLAERWINTTPITISPETSSALITIAYLPCALISLFFWAFLLDIA